jgi:hypothetical protein
MGFCAQLQLSAYKAFATFLPASKNTTEQTNKNFRLIMFHAKCLVHLQALKQLRKPLSSYIKSRINPNKNFRIQLCVQTEMFAEFSK